MKYILTVLIIFAAFVLVARASGSQLIEDILIPYDSWKQGASIKIYKVMDGSTTCYVSVSPWGTIKTAEFMEKLHAKDKNWKGEDPQITLNHTISCLK